VSLDPFASETAAISATLPLFIVILACIMLGVVAGGTATWVNQGKWRRHARRIDADMRALRMERDDLKSELAARDAPAPLPAVRRSY
jgi:hypothetical protein